MKPTVISDPAEARKLRRLSDSGRIPVIAGGRVLGGAGRSQAGAEAVLAQSGLRPRAAPKLADAACLWIGDHPPRAARALKVPGDKRPYVVVRVWVLMEDG